MVLPPEIAGAAVECDIETLQRFLDQHPERVNDVDESDGPISNRTMIDLTVCGLSQRPPAHVLQALRLLLSRGADVNGRLGPEDPTGLHKSCLYAWREGVEALLQAGAEVNLTCRHTSTSARLTPWQKYCLAPPKELLRLRSLVARRRARERKRLRAKTPREIVTRTVNGTGHTGPSEFCATSI